MINPEISQTDDTIHPITPKTQPYYGEGVIHHVRNSNRHFAADETYYFVVVRYPDGHRKRLMFTAEELDNGAHRYRKKTEDSPEPKTFLQKLLSGEFWRFFE